MARSGVAGSVAHDGEHPDAGVGVDDESGARELGRGPPHGLDEQLGGLRTGLEERRRRHPEAAAGDVLLEGRGGTDAASPRAGRRTSPRDRSQRAASSTGRHRHPQRELDAGVEVERRQQRGQALVGDEAVRRGHDVVGVLGAVPGLTVGGRRHADRRAVAGRASTAAAELDRSVTSTPPMRRRASATISTLAARWVDVVRCCQPQPPHPARRDAHGGVTRSGDGSTTSTTTARWPSPASTARRSASTVSPGMAPWTNTTRPSVAARDRIAAGGEAVGTQRHAGRLSGHRPEAKAARAPTRAR